MRLGKILLYTSLGGFSLAFSQLVGSEDSGFGVFGTLVYLLSGSFDSRFQSILFFVSIVFTILSIYGTSRLLVQIYNNKCDFFVKSNIISIFIQKYKEIRKVCTVKLPLCLCFLSKKFSFEIDVFSGPTKEPPS